MEWVPLSESQEMGWVEIAQEWKGIVLGEKVAQSVAAWGQ